MSGWPEHVSGLTVPWESGLLRSVYIAAGNYVQCLISDTIQNWVRPVGNINNPCMLNKGFLFGRGKDVICPTDIMGNSVKKKSWQRPFYSYLPLISQRVLSIIPRLFWKLKVFVIPSCKQSDGLFNLARIFGGSMNR